MLKHSFLLVPLLAAGSVFLTGAWTIQTAPSAPSVPVVVSPFVPQLFPIPEKHGGADVAAEALLDRAIQSVAADRVSWLKTKIQLKMIDAESTFVAEGLLQRGPNGCARLELQVETDGVPSRLLIVSDGELLAEERRIHNATPVVACSSFNVSSDTDAVDPAAREAHLARKGCAGPAWVLQELRTSLRKLHCRTGLLDSVRVLEIKGEMGEGTPPFANTSVPVRQARVYLDSENLWPRRVELWTRDPSASWCVVEMEFRDPALNQELPLEECMRVFSYQPDPSIAKKIR